MQLTGLCLSYCVRDMMDGKVKFASVEKIFNATVCKNHSSWEIVLAEYAKTFWQKNPQKGIKIARRLIKAGRVVQPRIEGKPLPKMGCNGWWLNQQSRIVFFP